MANEKEIAMTDTERAGRALGTILRECAEIQVEELAFLPFQGGNVLVQVWSPLECRHEVCLESSKPADIATALEELEAQMMGVADD